MANLLKLSEATALALHTMVIISNQSAPISAAPMAEQLQASEAHVFKVLQQLEGPMRADGCLFSQSVCGGLNCILGTLVEDVRTRVIEHFSSTTLDQAGRK